MKKLFQISITIFILSITITAFASQPGFADLNASMSKNKQYLIEMIPNPPGGLSRGKGTVYKFKDGKKGEILWSFNGYCGWSELSSTGEHIVTCNRKQYPRDRALVFYHRNKLLKQYLVRDLCKIRGDCRWSWDMGAVSFNGHDKSFRITTPRGFSADGLTYTVVTADLTVYEFDVTTGEIKRSYFDIASIADYANKFSISGLDGQTQSLGDLIRTGNRSIPILIKLLNDKDEDKRYFSAVALSAIKPKAEEAVPVLIDMLEYCFPELCPAIGNLIGRIGTPAVPMLIKLMNNENESEHARRASIVALGYIGPGAKKAVPALLKMIKDESGKFPHEAANALAKIEEPSVPTLINLLNDKNLYSKIGWPVIRALSMLGPDANEAAIALVNILKDESKTWYEIDEIINALAEGWLGKIATPALIQLYNDKNEKIEVRMRAAVALALIGPEEKKAIPALIKVLVLGSINGDSCPCDRYTRFAALALSNMGPNAKETVPTLLKFCIDKERRFEVREDVANALVLLEPNTAQKAISVLIKEIFDMGQSQFLGGYFEGMGPNAQEAAPTLIRWFYGNDDPEFRFEVALALTVIRPKIKEAIPILIKMFSDEVYFLAPFHTALTLGNMGPIAKEAVPAILKAMDERIISEAVAHWALKEIDPDRFKHLEYLHIKNH
ncbi:HEAT repeat domain-containing protein [Thermodesulfobacteriota bacterium]